jgi:hypothetical protein
MSFLPSWNADTPFIHEELVRDRIRTLHREAEHQRLVSSLQRVRRARRQAERASLRLRHALARLV